MKFIIFLTAPLILFHSTLSAEPIGDDVRGKVVETVYQQNLEPTEFEFVAEGYQHGCGGTILRVRSNTTEIANRKFSLLTTALVSGKPISFRETGVCIPRGRMEVSWVQLHK